MKKSLIALAVLAASGAAMAQSSVTLFGVVDASVSYRDGSGNGNVWALSSGNNASSRLGFRGVEDLGGGMKASFWLEASVVNDNGAFGTTSTNNQPSSSTGGGGLTFGRRSTVSLQGNWGELRLGRDYVPSFWNHTVFDPFGTVGAGSYTNVSLAGMAAIAGTAGPVTGVRASNSVGYLMPTIGGFYGQVMYAMGENASNGAVNTAAESNNGDVAAIRAGWSNGPINVAIAYAATKFYSPLVGGQTDYKNANIGGSYNFGVATVMANWNEEKGAGVTNETWLLGASMPFGASEFKASVAGGKISNAANNNIGDTIQFSLGYVYNMSKRTALYATYSGNSNDGNTYNYNNGRAASTPGGSTYGLDFGVRHSF